MVVEKGRRGCHGSLEESELICFVSVCVLGSVTCVFIRARVDFCALASPSVTCRMSVSVGGTSC